MKKAAALILCLLFVLCASNAQTKFEKATSDPAKLEKSAKMDFPRERGKNGKGYAPYYPALGAPPAKVALVSFAVTDPGWSKKANTPNATVWSTTSSPEGMVKIIVNGYHAAGIEALQKTFAEYGMELMTPDQYLDTDEKKEFYMEWDFSPKEHFINQMSVTSSYVLMGAEGYRYIVPMYEPAVAKGAEKDFFYHLSEFKKKPIYEKLGYELCKGLDVDAVLMVNNVIYTKDKININIKYVNMVMFGLNPIQLPEGGNLYRKGSFYGAVRLLVHAPTKDTEDPAGRLETDGYENIMIGLSNKLGKWLQEECAKPDKR
jgi:hypothetical protein